MLQVGGIGVAAAAHESQAVQEAISSVFPNLSLESLAWDDNSDVRDAMEGGVLVNPTFADKVDKAALSKHLREVQGGLALRCEWQIRLLRSFGVTETILVLAPASSTDMLVDLVRLWHPKELVGCLEDYRWMSSAMTIVVASPDDEGLEHVVFHFLGAVAVPCAAPELQMRQLMSSYAGFWPTPGVRLPDLRPKNWLADSHIEQRALPSNEVQALLARHLPEALACPGLGDIFSRWITNALAGEEGDALFTDWSGVVAVLPGLVRCSMASSSTSCVVAAPASRVDQLASLIQGFVQCMGVKGVLVGCANQGAAQLHAARIVVGTPDKVVPSNATKKVVLVETDVLLASGFISQVEALLSIPGVQVGLHAVVRSLAVEDVAARFLPGNPFDPKAGLSLVPVDLYSAVVPTDGHKVAMVFKLWSVLRYLAHKMQLALYCNSPASVRKVGKELEKLGVRVRERHSEMGVEALKESETRKGYSALDAEVVVTDIYVPGSFMDVINYELPSTAHEFVSRVGGYRGNGRAKVVISIVSSSEEQQLLDTVASEYQVRVNSLPEKIPAVYFRSIRRV